jgi:hypothetical protein
MKHNLLSAFSMTSLTDNVSHAGTPTFLDVASFLRPSYTERIRGDAGSVFGRANGALMSAFKLGESFDIFLSLLLNLNFNRKLCFLSFLNISLDSIQNPARKSESL